MSEVRVLGWEPCCHRLAAQDARFSSGKTPVRFPLYPPFLVSGRGSGASRHFVKSRSRLGRSSPLICSLSSVDRAAGFYPAGRAFESCRERHFGTELGTPKPAVFALEAAM